ncbi:MAG: hypothetical protein ACYS5V_08170 [Planctomycetota bacterium]|jgi:hypothetical protein
MERYEWSQWADPEAVNRRAGGRRRYNAERRERVWERRNAILRWLKDHPTAMFFNRGVPGALAPVFGVHPSTIWRDLKALLWPPVYRYIGSDGEVLFAVTREYPGGPVVSVEDPDGNEIHGKARREIIKRLPRYVTRRRGCSP